jgi:hypothetical protein
LEPSLASNGHRANRLRLVLIFILLGANAYTAPRRHFTIAQTAEVIAVIEMASPGSDWATRRSEAAIAAVSLDGKLSQHVILFAGSKKHEYRIALGSLSPGDHELTIERDATQSAPRTELETGAIRIEEIATNHPEHDVHANAPVLFARLNTVGKFSDIPLLLYCERLQENGEPVLQYSVIFSNEDGGTSTRALMGRWGRATDIEYVYKRFVRSGAATVQGRNHVETEFKGQLEGKHPLLMPVTDNNMIAAAEGSPLKFRLAPILVDLSAASREQIMDRYPVTYEVMAKELIREDKLRPFGVQAGEKISDPRNYLYVDYAANLTNSAIIVSARLKDGSTYASDLGRSDISISRSGYVRTTIELPPGTLPTTIASINFDCRVAPPPKNEPVAHSGSCTLQEVPTVFQLREDYTPGKSIWRMREPVTLPTGRGLSFAQ